MKSALPTVIAILSLFSAAGCGDTPSTLTGDYQVSQQEQIADDDGKNDSKVLIEQQRIDAETLASILDVHVWSFKFSGGPVRCWLEIEEVGQETMPNRFPEGERFVNSNDEEGEVRFVWLTHPTGGGAMRLNCSPGDGHSFSLNSKSFVFDWKVWHSLGSTPTGQIKSIEANEGEEMTLMIYKASESRSADGTTTPRKVTLTLKAILGEKQRTDQ